MNHVCPKCSKSEGLVVGNFPLRCNSCHWHYLNDNPCDVCGKPSISGGSARGKPWHRCKEHGKTWDEILAGK